MRFITTLIGLLAFTGARACDLCAVYQAADARGETGKGFLFSLTEQFIPYRTSQVDGEEVIPVFPEYVDSSITHFVGGYNFSSRFGLSLNVPLTHLEFKRRDVRYSLSAPPVNYAESGSETGVGDVSLIGRMTVIRVSKMNYGFVVNVLTGVKFPTGDDSRLDDEVQQTKIFDAFVPPGTPHDPLGHSISSVHQHAVALGSGSFDGVFGVTANARWRRFFNGQFQYYLRTEGDSGFKYGDELMVSGGPGGFVVLQESWTLSLQANAVFDTMARDQVLGRVSNRTGSTAWYFGPLLNLTLGRHLSANAGVDVPLSIDNRGFQSVPDYRLHGGFSWRF